MRVKKIFVFNFRSLKKRFLFIFSKLDLKIIIYDQSLLLSNMYLCNKILVESHSIRVVGSSYVYCHQQIYKTRCESSRSLNR